MNNNLNELHKALLSLCHFVMFSQNTWNSNTTNTCYSTTYSKRFFSLIFTWYIKACSKLCMLYYNNLSVTAESRCLFNNIKAFRIVYYFFRFAIMQFFIVFGWILSIRHEGSRLSWSLKLIPTIFVDVWTCRWNIFYWFL